MRPKRNKEVRRKVKVIDRHHLAPRLFRPGGGHPGADRRPREARARKYRIEPAKTRLGALRQQSCGEAFRAGARPRYSFEKRRFINTLSGDCKPERGVREDLAKHLDGHE